MEKNKIALVGFITAVMLAAIIIICIIVPISNNTSKSTTTTVVPQPTTTLFTPTTWPTMYAIPFGFTRWRIIEQAYFNTSVLDGVIGQIVTTDTGTDYVWVESHGTSFSIAINLTLSSPSFAYYATSQLQYPVYIYLMPDLPHSNGQCILTIHTYPTSTQLSDSIGVPPNPMTATTFILF
jgi:hypothetical protein